MTHSAFLRSAVAAAALGLGAPALAGEGEAAWTTPEYRAAWQLGAVDAAGAYVQGYTGKGVTVGIFDSGLDTRHPEFAGRVAEGYDFANRRPITGAGNFDTDVHGTHVTGIIGAARDGVGMHGLAFDALLLPVIPEVDETRPDTSYADGWRFLADRGVPIINNSVGLNGCAEAITPPCNVTDYKPGQLERELPRTIAAMRHMVAKDVLMVFATGNEAQPAPDALAGMPFWLPELRDNWLAVGAIGQDGKIGSFSNRCGVAAEWCLVAPGVEDISTVPLGSGIGPGGGYLPETGTSMATPVVSGIAALVKQAFPFFNARDLQQTLLTTATDLGDRDAYGWGLVNAAKAVKGYGQFTAATPLDTAGFDATFGNDIGGAGSLVKRGAGTLTMTGDSTYQGGTAVLGGGLAVEGSLGSRVDVGVDGTLSGSGTIRAPLTVAGTLAPGGAGGGTLTVAGPVLLGDGAVMRVRLGESGDATRLVATGEHGTVALGGRLVPVWTDGDPATLGSRFEVIRASAGILGAFDALARPGSGEARTTRLDAIYGVDGVDLVVTPRLYGDLAAVGLDTSANADAAGAALDALRPAAGPRAGRLFQGLYAAGAEDLGDALGRLSGEIHASARTLDIEHAGMLRDALGERIRSDFDGEHGAFWSAAYGGWGEARGGEASELEWDGAGLLFGADVPAGEMLRLGIAGGFGRSRGEADGGDSTLEATHLDLAAYASARRGAFGASAGVAHGWTDVDSARRLSFGDLRDTATASYDGGATQVFGELGYRLEAGGAALTPFVSAAYLVPEDARFEEDGGPAALSGKTDADPLGVTVAGLRIAAGFDLGGGTLSTTAALGWQRLHGDTADTAGLAFREGPGFAVEGAGLSRDAARIELGAQYALGARAKAGLSYRGVIGGDSTASSLRGDFGLAF